MAQNKNCSNTQNAHIYRVDKKNVSKFQLRYLRNYALLLAEISCNITIVHHVVFIHGKLYDCSFTNIPTTSKTKQALLRQWFAGVSEPRAAP
jgi:hypothetical protein